MQENKFGSHTFFGGHMDANSNAYKPLEICLMP